VGWAQGEAPRYFTRLSDRQRPLLVSFHEHPTPPLIALKMLQKFPEK
jgi:hypothetical protein